MDQSALNRLVVVVSWVALLFAAALGVIPLVPPAPPAEQDAAAFSVGRAFDHVERIAQEPRPMGSAASQRARAYIVAQLEMLGLEPEVQIVEANNYYSRSAERIEIGNVVARIPGTAPTRAVALVGHYDTVPGTPGANDDASAVAILLEAARAIRAGGHLRNDVILVFIDGEEPAPRFGSSAFVAEHPWAGEIGFAINLEAAGSGGPSILAGMSGPGRWVINRYIEAVPYPAAFSFVTAFFELVGGSNSDFATFRDAGIAGVEFAYLRGSPIYHTPADGPERVSLHSLQQQGANTLALTRQIGNLELGPPHDDLGATFFSVGRFFVVPYPNTWALPIALVTGAVLAVASGRQRAWLRILRSFGITLATMVGWAAAAVGLWIVLASRRSTMGVAEGYLYLAGLLAGTAGIGIAVARVIRRRIGEGPDATGVVLVWWVLGLLTAVVAPGMSYLFVWPALAGGVALLWSTFGSRWWQPVLSVPVVGSALVLLTPAVDTFYLFAQPRPGNLGSQVLSAIAIPIVLLVLVVELVRVFWMRLEKRPAPVDQTPTSEEA